VRRQHNPWRISDIAGAIGILEVDLGEWGAVGNAISSIRPDWVFHLAAHGAYPSQTDVHEMVRTNLVATINLVEAALANESTPLSMQALPRNTGQGPRTCGNRMS